MVRPDRTKVQLNIKTVRSAFMTKSDHKIVVGPQRVEFCFKTIELQVGTTSPALVETGDNIYLDTKSFNVKVGAGVSA